MILLLYRIGLVCGQKGRRCWLCALVADACLRTGQHDGRKEHTLPSQPPSNLMPSTLSSRPSLSFPPRFLRSSPLRLTLAPVPRPSRVSGAQASSTSRGMTACSPVWSDPSFRSMKLTLACCRCDRIHPFTVTAVGAADGVAALSNDAMLDAAAFCLASSVCRIPGCRVQMVALPRSTTPAGLSVEEREERESRARDLLRDEDPDPNDRCGQASANATGSTARQQQWTARLLRF